MTTRTETDSFGPLEVQSDRYWGAQTQRSLMNFPIGWEKQPVAIVRALGVIKQACAMANKASGKLDATLADAMIEAAGEVIDGKLDDQFPLVVWQTGSGTQTRSSRTARLKSWAANWPPNRRFTRTITATWASRPTTPSPPRCTSPLQ
jgi:fumarate hydratase class II